MLLRSHCRSLRHRSSPLIAAHRRSPQLTAAHRRDRGRSRERESLAYKTITDRRRRISSLLLANLFVARVRLVPSSAQSSPLCTPFVSVSTIVCYHTVRLYVSTHSREIKTTRRRRVNYGSWLLFLGTERFERFERFVGIVGGHYGHYGHCGHYGHYGHYGYYCRSFYPILTQY